LAYGYKYDVSICVATISYIPYTGRRRRQTTAGRNTVA